MLAPSLLLLTGAVLVFPPGGPSGATPGWVGEAVADGLPRALGRLGVDAVDRFDRLRAHDALNLPRVSLTRATFIRIAECLGATRVVVGSYDLQGPGIALALRLLDVERGSLSAPFLASGPLETLPALVDSLAWDIALSGPSPPSITRAEFLSRARPSIPFQAVRLYAQGLAAPDAASRRRLVRQALAVAPAYDEARAAIGLLQIEAREHEAAYETLSRVSQDSPLARQARFLAGVALVETGRYRAAAELYARLVAEAPTPAALNNHALALLRAGVSGGIRASDELRKAVEMDAGLTDLTFNLGFALLLEGEAEAAAFWLDGLARRAPRDAQAHVLLAWALKKAGRTAEAEEEWRGVAALMPSYRSLETPDLARRFERVLPSERRLALDHRETSDVERAARLLAVAAAAVKTGDLNGALQELTQAVLLDPYGARVHAELARLHVARGERERALAEYKTSLWCREHGGVRLELARLLIDLGRTVEARAEAARILGAEPGNEAARRIVEGP